MQVYSDDRDISRLHPIVAAFVFGLCLGFLPGQEPKPFQAPTSTIVAGIRG